MSVQPYLFFNGRCEEAIELYTQVLGASVSMLMRLKDNPEPQSPATVPPGSEEKIMHASMTVRGSTVMVSDGGCMGQANFQGFALSIEVADLAEARRLFTALGDGGQVQMPLGPTFFSPGFGIVADRFGVSWMINVTA